MPLSIPCSSKNIIINLWYAKMGKDVLIGKIPENPNSNQLFDIDFLLK